MGMFMLVACDPVMFYRFTQLACKFVIVQLDYIKATQGVVFFCTLPPKLCHDNATIIIAARRKLIPKTTKL